MKIHDEILSQLRLSGGGRLEFKRIEFKDDTPTRSLRNSLADELVAFANAESGVILCGVTNDGGIQNMSREQIVALDCLLVDLSQDTIDLRLYTHVYHRQLEGTTLLVVEVPQREAVQLGMDMRTSESARRSN